MARGLVRTILREPLVHFVAGGALVWGFAGWMHARKPVLAVPATVVEGFRRELRARSGQDPSAAEVQRRIERYIDDEVLFREGTARGLGAGDPVVRQRVVQRMTFVLEGERSDPVPTDAQLRAYETAHADRYAMAPRYTFEQVYFGTFARRDRAQPDALAALAALRAGADPGTLGDRYPSGGFVRARTLANVGAEFGTDLAAQLATYPLGAWSGPVASPSGWHVVRVTARTPAGLLPLDAARAQLVTDYLADRASALDRGALAPLRARYDVRIGTP